MAVHSTKNEGGSELTTIFVNLATKYTIEMSLSVLKQLPTDTTALIRMTREGVSYALFRSIAAISPFSAREWGTYLHLTERTLQRYKREARTFGQPYSERILEIARLQGRGWEIFGEADKFNQWLNSNSIPLGGIRPKTLLDSSFGIDMLHRELTRIEHGVLA